jgi:putative transposase
MGVWQLPMEDAGTAGVDKGKGGKYLNGTQTFLTADGGKQTGENSLFRTLHPLLQEDDVVLADRYFSGWFDLALLRQRGVHSVVRKHQLRATDFRTARRLGHDDHMVVWAKPARPTWMTPDEYASLPEALTVREVRVRVRQPGFRTKELVVVTTLLDAGKYAATEVAKL